MDYDAILSAVNSMTVEDRVRLIQEVGESIPAEQLPGADRAAGRTWEEVKARLLAGRRRYSLEELLCGITEENRHSETKTGPPVGNEEW